MLDFNKEELFKLRDSVKKTIDSYQFTTRINFFDVDELDAIASEVAAHEVILDKIYAALDNGGK